RIPRLAVMDEPPPSFHSSLYEATNAINSYLEDTLESSRSVSSMPLGAIPFRISPEKCRKSRDNQRERQGRKTSTSTYSTNYKESMSSSSSSTPPAGHCSTMPTKSGLVPAYSTVDCATLG